MKAGEGGEAAQFGGNAAREAIIVKLQECQTGELPQLSGNGTAQLAVREIKAGESGHRADLRRYLAVSIEVVQFERCQGSQVGYLSRDDSPGSPAVG